MQNMRIFQAANSVKQAQEQIQPKLKSRKLSPIEDCHVLYVYLLKLFDPIQSDLAHYSNVRQGFLCSKTILLREKQILHPIKST